MKPAPPVTGTVTLMSFLSSVLSTLAKCGAQPRQFLGGMRIAGGLAPEVPNHYECGEHQERG